MKNMNSRRIVFVVFGWQTINKSHEILWPINNENHLAQNDLRTGHTRNGEPKKRKIAIENESSEIALVNMQLRLHATKGGGMQRRDDDATRGCQIEWNANFAAFFLSLPFSLSNDYSQ